MANMDDLYAELFGTKPTKRGTGYELITAAVIKHLNKSSSVTHDVFLKSSYSTDKHQLDGLAEVGSKSVFIEAKDHTEQGAKTGRPEIAKLAGSLLVLSDVDEAIFASATGYTGRAEQYVKDLDQAQAKPINLYIIRPTEKGDEEGRIQSINVKISLLIPQFDKAKWEPTLSPKAQDTFESIGFKDGDTVDVRMDGFYRSDGSLIASVEELTEQLTCDFDNMVSTGVWKFDEEAFIKINSALVPIEQFSYEIPHTEISHEYSIEADEPVIFVQAVDGSIDKLIGLEDLKTALEQVLRESA